MTHPDPWLDPRFAEGASHYDAGRYFEAHEAWEHLWRAQPPGEEKTQVQGLIQLAVCLEHHRRGNPRGRDGQWAKAVAKLTAPRAGPVDLVLTLAGARAALDVPWVNGPAAPCALAWARVHYAAT